MRLDVQVSLLLEECLLLDVTERSGLLAVGGVWSWRFQMALQGFGAAVDPVEK